MNEKTIKDLLTQVREGLLSVDAAGERLKSLPYDDLGFAKIDTHRALRRGFPEVIFCQGKTPDQIAGIAARMAEQNSLVLGMRADREAFAAVTGAGIQAEYHQDARAIVIGDLPEITAHGTIAVVSAGTADMPVAEEAALTARAMGNRIDRIYDAGIAGVHRLLGNREKLNEATVLIVVAGMEGALPGVVGGLLDKPVIAVPTSVGYGANFQGLSALLTMLNSCVPGIGVVNIDNGFGAGYLASMINRLTA
ncbi:nickel pincer cofactor biosynthesis protein LarB [bacterium]|nr:nickel pincer cofactor biosynthesis protein LarB [bacterium]